MKRGNTALKRGVGLASAFALAIAGAVIAAPAASAWPAGPATNLVRATPAVDAPWITASVDYSNTYNIGGTAVGTGPVPNLVVGQSFQQASSLQIALPATGGVPDWDTGDAVTVTLAGGATFSQVPSAISVAAASVNKADLDTHAGHTGTNATVAPTQGTGGLANAALPSAPSLDAAKTLLTIPLPSVATTLSPTGDTYLLSIDNIRLSVAGDISATTVKEITASVTGTGTAPLPTASTATIGYVNNLKIAANGDATITGTTVKLPPIVVTEAVKDAFAPGGASFTLTVTGTDASASNKVSLVGGTGQTAVASSTVTGTLVATSSVGPANTVVLTGSTASSASAVETVVISGIVVNGVKPGTDVTVSITTPKGTRTASSTFDGSAAPTASASVTVTPGSVLPRIAGANRYATAADIAATTTWTGNAVILANGENAKQGIDALSANFLAGVKSAPILLTPANSLATETKDALTKLFKDSTADITIYVMGKTDAVSQAVRDAAEAAVKATSVGGIATVTVKEVAGSDRYATSVAAVDAANSVNIASYNLGKGNLRTAFLASGQNNADALAAGAVSAGSQIPVYLTTNGAELPKSVSDALTADHIDQVVILGATDRVSQKVEDDLTAAGKNVIRLAGSDRFDTATKIATLDRKAPTDGTGRATGSDVYIANGVDGFPDALAIGPLAGQSHSSLVTVSNAATLPASTATFLKDNKSGISFVHAVGGKDRVQDSVITAAQDALK